MHKQIRRASKGVNIIVDGTEISEDTKNIEQVRAEVGMVFQQFNLFPAFVYFR